MNHTRWTWLEWLTEGVLLLVVAALGWMMAVADEPNWARLASVEVEIVVVLGLLIAALLLVSLVSLLHTR